MSNDKYFLRSKFVKVLLLCYVILLALMMIFNIAIPEASAAASGVEEYSYPSSITVISGVYDFGNLTSLQAVDGKYYRVLETVGSPCLDVRINFTNVEEEWFERSALSFAEYVGNPAHNCSLFIYNFTGDSWHYLHNYPSGAGLSWFNETLPHTGAANPFISIDNELWLRVDHVSNGSNGHYIDLDYFAIHYFDIREAWLNPLFVLVAAFVAVYVMARK